MTKDKCQAGHNDLVCSKAQGHRGWHIAAIDGDKGMTVEWMSMAAYQAGKWWHRDRGGDRDS